MEDSIFKQWEDKIDSLANADFKKGVLDAIRKLKEEVYSLKVDNINQQCGRVIRDDKRIILSAPEIIIGDVNLGGMLNPDGASTVVVRANDVMLQGVGASGQVDTRASIISQTAEDPGVDGLEHVVGNTSAIVSQAVNITLQSDKVKSEGVFPVLSPITDGGIRLKSDHTVDIAANKSHDNRLQEIEKTIRELEGHKPNYEKLAGDLASQFKSLRKRVDDLLDKKAKLATDAGAIRIDYTDLDELNISIEELSMQLSKIIYQYSQSLSLQAENNRMLAYFRKQKEAVGKISAEKFQKLSTKTNVNISGERINLVSIDGDGNVRSNKSAGVEVLTNKMSILGKLDEKGSLMPNNMLDINMRNIEISTAGTSNCEVDENSDIVKALYKAEGDFIVKSKNITLESVDYEVADKKLKEKGLTRDSNIKLRSKKVELSTVNSSDIEVDEEGKVTKAKYAAEGDVVINSKTFALKATDSEQNGEETKETALTKDSKFSVRTEAMDLSATDTEGKAAGKIDLNAKMLALKTMDVEKEKRTDDKIAEGSVMLLVSEKTFLGAKSKDIKGKTLQALSDDVALFANQTFEIQQGEAKAMLQLNEGEASLSGDKVGIYGATTINANTEIKGELKAPKGTIDNLEAPKSFQSKNISDGISVGGAGGGNKLNAEKKVEEAPKEE